MQLRDLLAEVKKKLRLKTGGQPNPTFVMGDHELDPGESAALASEASHELARLFYSHKGRVVNKWVHYLDAYQKEFSALRDRPIKLLEIGVSEGGSLELWRNYFGPQATIFGIDIDPQCAHRVDAPNQVRVGSQDDPEFLRRVVAEMGSPDIILDDGSHIGKHQEASFRTLFPLLQNGGLYLIEDLHSSYWPGFYQGGYRRRGSAIELAKALIDDMHGWYHQVPGQLVERTEIAGIRFYDSMVVIEKGPVGRPCQIKVGQSPEL